jgi:lipopolysaccharide transport system permease protein
VRYKQTSIGVAWSVIKPLLTIATMAFANWVFKVNIPGGVPRILFVYSATLPWLFFASTFSEVSGSMIGNVNLLTKVYFPRLIVPASTVIVCLLDFAISLGILIVLMIFFQFNPGWRIVCLPLFLLLAFIAAMGVGLWMAALNVKYRDFKFVVPFIVQLGIYVSPVAFSSDLIQRSSIIPPALKFIYTLNPMVGVIDGFRWCLLGGDTNINFYGLAISTILSVLLFIIGLSYFRKTERTFADVI